MSESTKMVEASRTDVGDIHFKAEVGQDDNSKHSDMHPLQAAEMEGKVLLQMSLTSPEQLGLMFSFIRLLDIHWLMSRIQCLRRAPKVTSNKLQHVMNAVSSRPQCKYNCVSSTKWGSAAAVPPPFRHGKPVLCGSRRLLTPY